MPASQGREIDIHHLMKQLDDLLEAEEFQILFRNGDKKSVFSLSKQDPLLPQLERLSRAFESISDGRMIERPSSLQKAQDLVLQLAEKLGDQNLADPKNLKKVREITDSIHHHLGRHRPQPKQ